MENEWFDLNDPKIRRMLMRRFRWRSWKQILLERQDWKMGKVTASFSVVEIVTISFFALLFLTMCAGMSILESNPCFMYEELTGKPCQVKITNP